MIPTHSPAATITSSSPYYEPYGEVRTTGLGTSSVAQRRPGDATSASQPTYFIPQSPNPVPVGLRPPSTPISGLSYAPPSEMSLNTSNTTKLKYQHNTTALIFLLPPLFAIMWLHASPYPLQTFLVVALCLYGLDLANLRQGAAICVWLGFGVLLCVSGWFILLDEGDDEDSGGYILGLMLRIGVHSFLYFCVACWCTLQFQWLYVGDDRETVIMMETFLHSILPPVAASVACFQLTSALIDSWGVDRAVTLAPYLFALLLLCGMLWLGSVRSSFSGLWEDNNQSFNKTGLVRYAISSFAARIHSVLLLLIPSTMHVLAFRRRIMSSNASFDDIYDLVLAWVFPYLLHYLLHMLHHSGTWKGPYAMSNILFPTYGNTLRGIIVPMMVTLVASLAVQQRYLIPLCHSVAYQFNGHDQSSNAVVSAFLSLATLSSLMAIWVWGRKSVQTGEPVFGEYHEDVVQLLLALGGFLVGKAFGMPWNLTPLPILAFLGLSVWATTRMLRYLAIFLFVLHAAGMVLLSYRFAGIDSKITLAIPWFQLTLIRFGMVIVFASILIGVVMGLSVRSSGGLGSTSLKKVDLAGILLITYAALLTTLEVTLLKQPAPFQELANIEIDETDGNGSADVVYDHATSLLTGAVLIALTLFMQKYRIISLPCSAITHSAAVGKLLAVFIDMYAFQDEQLAGRASAGSKMLFQMAIASLLTLAIVAPRAFLKPVYVKASARNKHAIGTKPGSIVPFDTDIKIWIYALVLLPLVLMTSIPYLLLPLSEVIAGHYSGMYYSVAPSMSEVAGLALSLWGLACLSMLNHLLPDAGGEGWKKVSALTFLMGVGLALSAPALPSWIGLDSRNASYNPFASISSLGNKIVLKDRSRIGGWGLVFASLATLLAVAGPLELRERRYASGKKDNFLMFRMMIFSIMFGCGASWFITILNMSEEKMAVILVTSIGCMAISFFGTVAAVLGYFVELENFEEVESIVLICGIGFPVFGLIAGIPQIMLGDAAHPFGTGGWLSTYLVVTGYTALGFATVLRSRASKNATTRSQGNLGTVVAWLCAVAVLYGRYGVAGLDGSFEVTKLLGVPISVIGTFLVAPILLILEGEGGSERRGRVQRLNAAPPKLSQSPLQLAIPQLNRSNRFAPLYSGTILVLLAASLHAILLRGCGWFFLGGNRAPKNQEEVFTMLFGSSGVGAEVSALAKHTILHSQALRTSARLAATGIWTTGNLVVPLLHLTGVAATLPAVYFIHTHLWLGQKPSTSFQVVAAMLLNLVPLALCWGLPSLLAIATIGLVGATLELFKLQQQRQHSQMRI